jgi:hypothetical protein
MIKNLLLYILIFFVVYIVLIFNVPQIAWVIENTLWINWFNQFVLSFKWTYDETVTKVPTETELKDAYNTVYSWAIEFKDNFDSWIEITKDKIDDFRTILSWAEDTYNDIKNWINDAKEFIETNSWTIEEIKEVIDTVSETSEILTNTWEIN